MERRKDYRHPNRYTLSMKCPHSGRVVDDVSTYDVSASGLSFASLVPHCFSVGDRLEVQLIADVPGRAADDMLILATRGRLVRAEDREGAVSFDAPLAY
ncbi:MAG: PilZ domain-containing protein [Planctomycetota bacterium]|jgi:hypothetical protein